MVKQIVARLLLSRPIPWGTQSMTTKNRVCSHLYYPTELFDELRERYITERKTRPKISFSAFVCELVRKGLQK